MLLCNFTLPRAYPTQRKPFSDRPDRSGPHFLSGRTMKQQTDHTFCSRTIGNSSPHSIERADTRARKNSVESGLDRTQTYNKNWSSLKADSRRTNPNELHLHRARLSADSPPSDLDARSPSYAGSPFPAQYPAAPGWRSSVPNRSPGLASYPAHCTVRMWLNLEKFKDYLACDHEKANRGVVRQTLSPSFRTVQDE